MNKNNRESKLVKIYNAITYNPSMSIGLFVILFFVFIAIFTPLISPHAYYEQNMSQKLLPPLTPGYLLGTDQFGRCILSRLFYGAGISIKVGVVVTGISIFIGIFLGSVGGYFGKMIDLIISTLIDVTWIFPLILVALVIVAVRGPGLDSVMIGIILIIWSGIARVVRGEVLNIKNMQYIKAAESLGVNKFMIIIRHIIPNIIPYVLVLAAITMAQAILVESTLSFFGLGIQPPLASWGTMLNEGKQYLNAAPWIAIFPGLAIVLLVLAFNLLADGIRDFTDPKRRNLSK